MARRPSAASRSAAVSLPFSTNFARLFSIVAARAIEHRLRDVDERHRKPGLREHLGDPVAHRARADHADRLDHVATSDHEGTKVTKTHEESSFVFVFFVSS